MNIAVFFFFDFLGDVCSYIKKYRIDPGRRKLLPTSRGNHEDFVRYIFSKWPLSARFPIIFFPNYYFHFSICLYQLPNYSFGIAIWCPNSIYNSNEIEIELDSDAIVQLQHGTSDSDVFGSHWWSNSREQCLSIFTEKQICVWTPLGRKRTEAWHFHLVMPWARTTKKYTLQSHIYVVCKSKCIDHAHH